MCPSSWTNLFLPWSFLLPAWRSHLSPSSSWSFVNFSGLFSPAQIIQNLLLCSTSQNRCSWVHLGTAAVWTPRPPSISTPLTLTLPSVTLPPVLCVFLRFLGEDEVSGVLESLWFPHRVEALLPALPFKELIVNADTKKSLQKTQASARPDKGVAAARTQNTIQSHSRHGLEFLQARDSLCLQGQNTAQAGGNHCESEGHPAVWGSSNILQSLKHLC